MYKEFIKLDFNELELLYLKYCCDYFYSSCMLGIDNGSLLKIFLIFSHMLDYKIIFIDEVKYVCDFYNKLSQTVDKTNNSIRHFKSIVTQIDRKIKEAKHG